MLAPVTLPDHQQRRSGRADRVLGTAETNCSTGLRVSTEIIRKRELTVKDQLEALVTQMYKSGILYDEAVREFKKRFIQIVLQENHGNQCKAARELGMHRNTLSRTITELKLDLRTIRDGSRRPPRSA